MDKARPVPLRSLLITVILALGVGLVLLKIALGSRELYHNRTLQAELEDQKRNTSETSQNKDMLKLGKKLYLSSCASCHGVSGEGGADQIPPLSATHLLSDIQFIHIIRFGLQGKVEVNGQIYNNLMPPVAEQWNKIQIASLMSHVQNHYGNKQEHAISPARAAELIEITRKRNSKKFMTPEELGQLTKFETTKNIGSQPSK